jgi:hypothetical protein
VDGLTLSLFREGSQVKTQLFYGLQIVRVQARY